MPEKKCPQCQSIVVAEDMDEAYDYYHCETCGWEECDSEGYANRMADMESYVNDMLNDR